MFLTLSLHPLVCFPSLSIQQRHLFCVRWEQGESLFTCTPSPELNHSSKTNARIHSGKPSSKGLKSFLPPPASYTSFGKEVENDSRTVVRRRSFPHSPVLALSDKVTSLTAQDPRDELLLIPTSPWIPTMGQPREQSSLDSPGNDGGQLSWGKQTWVVIFVCLQERSKERHCFLYRSQLRDL